MRRDVEVSVAEIEMNPVGNTTGIVIGHSHENQVVGVAQNRNTKPVVSEHTIRKSPETPITDRIVAKSRNKKDHQDPVIVVKVAEEVTIDGATIRIINLH